MATARDLPEHQKAQLRDGKTPTHYTIATASIAELASSVTSPLSTASQERTTSDCRKLKGRRACHSHPKAGTLDKSTTLAIDMSVDIAVGTPLAEALHNAVLPKFAEAGWSSGVSDDSQLAEYVVLMLVSKKTKEEIASELSNDLLGLGPDDPGAVQFAQWLFDQVDILDAQLNGQAPMSAPAVQAEAAAAEEAMAAQMQPQDMDTGDAEMGDASGSMSVLPRERVRRGTLLTDHARPTGPKSMRNGGQKSRDKRMLGQINKNLTGTGDAALHRVRGANGAGRINSHNNRDPPKG
ncbi:MAG: hypothetical protein INR71_12880, partial [Terriglobus roseus]|nr:hypothetical protein [Terriglobus roseus]